MLQLRKQLNTEYLSKFEKIEGIVYNIAGKTRIFFPKYTNHGTDYLTNVENYVNLMIPDNIKEQMSEEEIFFLLCAVWLHDIGMVPQDEHELNNFESTSQRKDYRDNVRELHHIRSDNYIKDNYDKLGLNKLEAKIIGQIAKGHRKINLKDYNIINYNGKSINVAGLAAILRLADECDVSKERESKLSPIDIDEKTREKHYLKHELVNHVWFDHEKGIIYISCIIENEEDYQHVNEVFDEITNKLNQTSDFLLDFGINLCSVKLDTKWNKLYEKQIISYIASHNYDITSWKIDEISKEEIYEILDNLKAEGLFKEDDYTRGFKEEDTVYIKLFKKFGGSSNFKTFYFTKYSQSTIPKCFENFVNKFSATIKEDKENMLEILKNSPTAFYLMLKFEDVLDDKKFNEKETVNGPEMMDYLLLMSLFNDVNYYKEEINFNNVKTFIRPLIKDEQQVLKSIEDYKNEGELNNREIISEEKSNDKLGYNFNSFNNKVDVNKSMHPLSEFNRVMKERVIKFTLPPIKDSNIFGKIMKNKLMIEKIKLKIDDEPDEVPFLFNYINNEIILLVSRIEKLDIRLRVKISDFQSDSCQIRMYICPKSEKIKDILNWLNFVNNNSEKNIELTYLDEELCHGTIPKNNIAPEIIDFYDTINKFNDDFKLDIMQEYDYEITNVDKKYVEFIKSLMNNKNINVPSINVKLNLTASKLDEIINADNLPIEVGYNYFPIKLLNNNIDLGEYKVNVDEAEIINKTELSKIVSSHEPQDVLNVTLIIKDKNEDELTLDFS